MKARIGGITEKFVMSVGLLLIGLPILIEASSVTHHYPLESFLLLMASAILAFTTSVLGMILVATRETRWPLKLALAFTILYCLYTAVLWGGAWGGFP